ncbi:MAG: slipin family protein [Deltaproteobacteria bacterium]|nr:slipin family protein [Deltaproteobacteria bacterium]MBI3076950.1 slipin family protein [Deltaproteobacteria bacterium]
MLLIGALVVILVIILSSAIRVLNEYERGVVFRLGRVIAAKGPGLILLIPVVDRMVRVSLRTVTMAVPPQDVITRDNVSIKVSAVIYFRVLLPVKAVIEVEDYLFATSQLAQTTLRNVCGQAELDQLLAQREHINERLQEILDHQTDPWGIKVSLVEIKHIDLPQEMQRAMAKQAEAERERRAKVINAEGEFQAATKLAAASDIMNAQPMALQLRFLQAIREISAEKSSTMVVPIPVDLIQALLEDRGKGSPAGS